MASGWTLLAAAGALGVVAVLAIRLLSQKLASNRISAEDSPLLLGPLLIVLGIIFGDDLIVGYALIGSGVIMSLVVSFQRRKR